MNRTPAPTPLCGRILSLAALSLALLLVLSAQPVAAATPEEEQKAAELKKTADEAKAREDQAAEALKVAQAKAAELQTALTRFKNEIGKSEKAATEAEAKLKPEQEKVQKADADKKTVDAAAAVTKKAVDDLKVQLDAAEKKAAEDVAKVVAAAKVLTDAQAALTAVTEAVNTSKKMVADGQAGLKTTEEHLAAFQPQLDQTQTQFAAVSAEHLQKRKAAEQALIAIGQLVSFSDSVAPIFAKRCLACHNAKTAKGRYNMETFASILKGGESGAAVEHGKAGESTLFMLLEDGSMPQDADPLTKEQLEIVKHWINTGATLDAGFTATQPLIEIMPKLPQPPAPEAYPVPVPVTALAFSPDGATLASSGYHEVILWKVEDGSVARRITNVAERVYDIDFTQDGTKLIVAAGTPAQIGEVKIFQTVDGALLGDLVRTDDSVFGVAVSPDGKRLATCGADRSIRVFDLETLKQELLIEDHADWVMDVAWSPDGSKLASSSRDKTSKVFDAKTGDSLVTFNGHGEPVYGVGFSPDGALVVTSGNDKQIRTWNVSDAKQVRAIGGFGNEVFRLAITADGEVFSCSADKTARSHKIADGAALKTFSGHTDWVYSVAVNPATKRVAAGSYNGEVRVWNVEDAKETLKFVAAPGYQPAETAAAK